MRSWNKVEEDGMEFWISDIGNIAKTSDNAFVAIWPKMLNLGPYKTLEEAQQSLEENKKALENIIENYIANLNNK